MRLKLNRVSGIFFICCVLTGNIFSQTAQPSPEKKDPEKILSQNNKDQEIQLPEVEGWTRGEILRYPDKRMGYGVNYDSQDAGRVSIYIYNLGMTKIPDGAENDVVKEEIERAKAEIFTVGRMGLYQDVKDVKSEIIALGGKDGKLKARHSLLNFILKGKSMNSEIYLFGLRNNFVKIRATYPKAETDFENAALADFLTALEKMMTKTN